MDNLLTGFYVLFFSFLFLLHFAGKWIDKSDKKSLEKEKQRRYNSIGADIAEYNSVYKSHDTSDLVYLLQSATRDNSSDSDGGSSND